MDTRDAVQERIEQAVAFATAYTERMLAEKDRFVDTFVAYEDYAEGEVVWLTAEDYYHGWGQGIPEQHVIWNYCDGYY